jgi:hypothetical protein
MKYCMTFKAYYVSENNTGHVSSEILQEIQEI